MIRYTGNPYVDAGVAVLELRLKKPIAQFTDSDLERQAEALKIQYDSKIWRGYLTVHFPNSGWANFNIGQEAKDAHFTKVLRGYKKSPLKPGRCCAICGDPAHVLADRSVFPMLTGETIMVAGPGGSPGLPLCGYCLYAVQFYPLGTLKVGKKPLFWWVAEPTWLRELTRRFQRDVAKVIAASSDKLESLPWPSTQMLRAARDVVNDLQKMPAEERPSVMDVTGIHATNFGSDPDYEELRIPRGLLEFWADVGNFGSSYREIEEREWIAVKKPRKKSGSDAGQLALAELSRRNELYEQLGRAFRSSDFRVEAKRIAVRFFMRRTGKFVLPNTTALVEFFLEKVASMEKQRLKAIRDIADAISKSPDRKRLLNLLMRSGRSMPAYLATLRAVQHRLAQDHHAISWESVLLALNLSNDDDATGNDAWLVSELVLIRLFECIATEEPALLNDIPETDFEIQETN